MNNPITDICSLPLDHPGVKDPIYRERRNLIAKIARDYQSTGEVPQVDYTDQEHETWRIITHKLAPLHQDLASEFYLKAREALPIALDHIPQLWELDTALRRFHGFGIGPVEGLIDSRIFLGSFQKGLMLCTQYIRHHSKPEYTPEPDIVHEVIGHVPMFTDPDFVAFSQLIGAAALKATEEELQQLERLYWFTLEFGLIQEGRDIKAYGAGLLSSFGEIQHCFTEAVDRKVFNLEEVFHTEYDFSHMQKKLFIIPSFKELRQNCEPYLRSLSERP